MDDRQGFLYAVKRIRRKNDVCFVCMTPASAADSARKFVDPSLPARMIRFKALETAIEGAEL